MCGFAGIARPYPVGVSADTLTHMAGAIRHRGPEGHGIWTSERAGLAHVRLRVLDLDGGAQPMKNDDGRIVIAYNGEVFNYVELRSELTGRGHAFRTRSDTEVVLRAYEEWGAAMVERLNGQFAFAIYDARTASVLLARDRFGMLPLFYAESGGSLYFGSEIKALFASGELDRAPDADGLDEVFTFWGARAPRTPFRGVRSIEPGQWARWRDGAMSFRRYYTLDYAGAASEPASVIETLDELMSSAVGLRMRSDVPVGGYLSGGVDSNLICALAAKAASPLELRTFSVAFDERRFDESAHQRDMAAQLGSIHNVQLIRGADIAREFPGVVRHSETPMVRTAPAPLYLLSKLAHEHGIKVVLSGEGADEVFWGYELFVETALRLRAAGGLGSSRLHREFGSLYRDIAPAARRAEFWSEFFTGAGPTSDPLFSHLPRLQLTSRIKEFYSDEWRAQLAPAGPLARLRDELPERFGVWSPLARAAYLEMVTLLAPYLLATQGDRMAMAHGVELRTPYLDHRLFEFAAALPDATKLRGTHGKAVLRRYAERIVPARVARRRKHAYRAPDVPPFFADDAPEYIAALLEPEAIRATGIFNPRAVDGLLKRCRDGRASGVRESQAFIAVLSTQLWHHEFIDQPVTQRIPDGTNDVLPIGY